MKDKYGINQIEDPFAYLVRLELVDMNQATGELVHYLATYSTGFSSYNFKIKLNLIKQGSIPTMVRAIDEIEGFEQI